MSNFWIRAIIYELTDERRKDLLLTILSGFNFLLLPTIQVAGSIVNKYKYITLHYESLKDTSFYVILHKKLDQALSTKLQDMDRFRFKSIINI